MPVPSVRTIASLTPRAAPARCSAIAAVLPSLSTNTGRPSRSAITSAKAISASGGCTRDDGHAGSAVDQARHPEAHRLHLGARRFARFLDRIDRDVE